MTKYLSAQDAIDAGDMRAAEAYSRTAHPVNPVCHKCSGAARCTHGCSRDVLSDAEFLRIINPEPVEVYYREPRVHAEA